MTSRDIKDFPFDAQVFEIEIQTFGCPVQRKDFRRLCRIVPCRIEDIRYSPFAVQDMLQNGQKHYLSELHGLESMRFDLMGACTQIEAHRYEFLGMFYSKLILKFSVQRKWQYYRSRIFTVLFLIVLLSFLVFGFSIQEFEQRLNVLITLFLAGVAFQFTVGETIPRVGYMTKLDYYLMITYIFLTVVAFESLTVNQLDLHGHSTLALELDKYALYAIPTLWILYNIYYFVAAYLLRLHQHNVYTSNPWTKCVNNVTPSPEQVQVFSVEATELKNSLLDSIAEAFATSGKQGY
eukprot:m.125209 g.125209  ORF g.125209 m.125209 type:complete len:293 (+) comp17317_c0_seq11:194-1072(+)